MTEKLVIVESPSKAKTINSYLGKEYQVLSSVGHIRDLATSGPGGLGLDVNNNFKPDYQISKGKTKVVNELKKAAKNREVLIATDPDREGEAIAWHIADVLNLDIDQKNRIVFTEITKPAILGAIDKPREIDMDLVHSQEVRRALDRIIGFKLSTLLQKKIKSKSAGRVQSVALKLIVDLEKEILAFIPEEYYEIEAVFEEFKANYIIKANQRIKKDEAMEIVKNSTNPFVIKDIEVKETKRSPKPPFTTSTLQQDANINLNLSGARTMALAQQLYEGIEIDGEITGLITYMRTDSTRLSDIFIKDALNVIKDKYGNDYVGTYHYEKKEGSQDAHEGIRPTSLKLTPKKMEQYLDKYQHRLYERIYNRALASLMSNAIFERTKVIFDANGNLYDVSGVREVFKGFLEVYDDQKTKDVILPKLNVGDKLNASAVNPIRKETQPKSRYTEASLIKEMEKLGIGRPSTYAQTIQTLKSADRNYLTVEKKKLIPTKQGILTVEQLDEFFKDIINVNYTSAMEENLDKVSEGKADDIKLLADFYNAFIPMIDHANINMKKIGPEVLDEACPLCGQPLVLRNGKNGPFIGCSNFPTCRYTRNIEKNEKNEENNII
ncbi:type I DNA topoisomerase [Haploplasma axanthum]|uniref:DNA topoisomerase 1 n=1 Tax=Haploplasma axanthum TaxID=29552 RepID=A0A449BD60_HAPAX|nr:type I DNA topoisomerase [Haploplasma axanthum]VEU80368.1 DNA topoisomerase 1 [Haploplasma axanthum]